LNDNDLKIKVQKLIDNMLAYYNQHEDGKMPVVFIHEFWVVQEELAEKGEKD